VNWFKLFIFCLFLAGCQEPVCEIKCVGVEVTANPEVIFHLNEVYKDGKKHGVAYSTNSEAIREYMYYKYNQNRELVECEDSVVK